MGNNSKLRYNKDVIVEVAWYYIFSLIYVLVTFELGIIFQFLTDFIKGERSQFGGILFFMYV